MSETHDFSEETEPSPDRDLNRTKIVPVCSCGWRGFGIASYNDDLFYRLRSQRTRHLIAAAKARTGQG